MGNWIFKLFMKVQVAVFRWSKGKSMGSMRGMPLLLLNTVGRKTHQAHTTPLMYLRDGENYVIIASNNGRDRHPGWFYNLQAEPQAVIELPGQHLEVTASLVGAAEYKGLWSRLISQAPFYDNYRKGTTRHIPMVQLKPR